MLLYNATERDQSIKAFGNWFNFKPGQVKNVQENFGRFICMDKKEYGVVELPVEFEDPAFAQTEAGIQIMADRRIEGRTNRVLHIKRILHNETVSLKKDLEIKGEKVNPDVYMMPEVAALYDELVLYKREKDDAQRVLMDKVQSNRKKLNE